MPPKEKVKTSEEEEKKTGFIENPFNEEEGVLDFEVKAVKEASSSNDHKWEMANISLMRPPFQLVMVAPTNTGKSTVLVNLLKRKQFGYADYFKRVRVFSKSLLTDGIWAVLTDEQLGDSYEEYNADRLLKDWEEQKKAVEKDGRDAHPELWIFDDMAAELMNRGGKPTPIMSLYMRARHTNISVVVTSQKYRLITSAVRTNARWMILFNITNQAELKQIYEELGIEDNYKEMRNLFRAAWKHSRFSFVNAHLGEPRVEDRYFVDFNKKLTADGKVIPLKKMLKVDNTEERRMSKPPQPEPEEDFNTKPEPEPEKSLKRKREEITPSPPEAHKKSPQEPQNEREPEPEPSSDSESDSESECSSPPSPIATRPESESESESDSEPESEPDSEPDSESDSESDSANSDSESSLPCSESEDSGYDTSSDSESSSASECELEILVRRKDGSLCKKLVNK